MEKKYYLMMFSLSAVPFIMVLGNSMLIPEFPQIKSALNINQFQVGLLITTFSISAGITIPFLGYLCDRIGRKKVIIPALLIYGIGGLISGFAGLLMDKPYNIIILGRVVQGIGAAGTAPIVMALVGDIFQSRQRSEALGIIEAANGLGKVLSPILGSAIGLVSWTALFFTYAVLALPIAAGVYFWSQEKNKPQRQKLSNYLKNIIGLFKQRGFSLVSTILAGMLVLFVLFGLLSYFSDILEADYNIKGFVKGLVIAIPIVFMSTTSYTTGFLLKKIKKYFKISILTGIFLIITALISLNYIKTLVLYLIFFSVIGIGTGLVLPAVNTMVTSSCASNQRGIITSLYGGARFVGVAIGPPAFTSLLELGKTYMYYGTGLISLLILIINLLFLKEKGMVPEENN